MGETRVDLQHLLEDLRDAYTGPLEETILTEVVANALDSGAARVRLMTNAGNATLTIVDDGRGMQRKELARYHDVAASSKTRGAGIGFAGVGIKLGLLVSREVVTETRRGATHVATRWHLASRHRAPWKWIPPPGVVSERGTAVQLTLTNQLSPLLDAGYVEEAIHRHFEPLFQSPFDELLRRHYPQGISFEVDGRQLTRGEVPVSGVVPVAIRLGRRRTPSAVGWIGRSDAPLPDHQQGIAVSTFGKVIKRGWDWIGLAPAARAQVTGLVEAPDLAACLTLSKNDFIRTGTRGATYLAYRKAVQEVVSRQLGAWGDAKGDDARPRVARLERDLERVLEDLSDDFPLLRSLVDRRAGGQKRLPMPGRGTERVPAPLFAQGPFDQDGPTEGRVVTQPDLDTEPAREPSSGEPEPARRVGEEIPPSGIGHPSQGAAPHPSTDSVASVTSLDTVAGRRRPVRYGLLVQFDSRAQDPELARLVDSTIWINDAHPAYTRAIASRSGGYHTALAVAMALAPLAVEARDEHAFITQFLAHWGGAQKPARSHRRRRGNRTA